MDAILLNPRRCGLLAVILPCIGQKGHSTTVTNNDGETTVKTFTKSLAALGIAGAAALTLAPMAAAQTPPIPEGMYTLTVTVPGQPPKVMPMHVYYCGDSCFSLGSKEYRFDPASNQWRGPNGWTTDGVTFQGAPDGSTAVLTH